MLAYILVTARSSKVKEALSELNRLSAVKSAYAVTGPFDIILLIEEASIKDIGRVVVEEIQKIEGVERTLTCLVVED
jgi:DNA-binding Lrp family transcriptional regulator